MDWKPRNKRLFVFSVPKKNRFAGSKLFKPKPLAGAYTEAQHIWVLSAADDCIERWAKGTRAMITDDFELEPVQLDMWEAHKDDTEFASLRKYIEEVDGEVECKIVSEGSILGIVEE